MVVAIRRMVVTLHQTIKQVMREHARLGNTLILLAFHPTFSLLASRPDYIKYTKEMKATGQG